MQFVQAAFDLSALAIYPPPYAPYSILLFPHQVYPLFCSHLFSRACLISPPSVFKMPEITCIGMATILKDFTGIRRS